MDGEERTRILNMLRDGKITTEEAEELLDALKSRETAGPAPEPVVMKDPRGRKPKKLHILVDNDEKEKGKAKVNVSIPISLVKSLGPLALYGIPKDVKRQLEEQGINAASILSQIEDLIENGGNEDFVNVDTNGKDDGEGSKVRIYVE